MCEEIEDIEKKCLDVLEGYAGGDDMVFAGLRGFAEICRKDLQRFAGGGASVFAGLQGFAEICRRGCFRFRGLVSSC